MDSLRTELKTLQKKLQYYEEDISEKENMIEELRLKGSQKETLMIPDYPHQETLSLIDEENSVDEL